MARSTYVYLVYLKASNSVIAARTVRHEVVTWMEKSDWPMEQMELRRTRDGGDAKRACPIVKIDPYTKVVKT